MISIRCKNSGQSIEVPAGSTLEEIYDQLGLKMENPPVIARVNNKVEGMRYRLYKHKDVEFLDVTSASGRRTYTRSLFFVLCKAAHELWADCRVWIDIPVSNGYYVDLQLGRPVTLDDVGQLRRRMQEIIAAAMPIHRHEATTEEVIRMFAETGMQSKVKLLQSRGSLYTTYCSLDGYKDYFYGAMLTNTSQLYLFGLEKYYDGVLLRLPSRENPKELGELVMQDKMFGIFKEHHRWQSILGLRTVGDINEVIEKGYSSLLIQISEALQEKKISQIADDIARRRGIRMVLISGPSSSGKTTTCKRLSVQLAVNSIKPVPISLDDYFVDRENTPRDASGDYDFEHLHALNLPLFNEQLNALLRGEEVELPRYDFHTGRSLMSGTDNRLLRRIIRDHKYRGVSAVETIRRWPSVRSGENRWIFPYQERADQMFNTAMLFELAVIKRQAEPLLEQVPENCVEYAEAHRLLKFLHYIRPIPEDQIPPTSLLREFLGGSSFNY